MFSAGKKNCYAIVCSLLIHLLLFVIVGVTATYVYGSENGEIFETMNYIEDVKLLPEKQKANNEFRKVEQHETSFEIVLYNKNQLRQLLENTKPIKMPKRENVVQNKPKTAIVKAPAVSPKILIRTPVPYPAGGNGSVGTVLVCVLVGIDGKPEYVSIARSSGNHLLDGAAVDNCINWRFSPAKDAIGKNVRCLIYIPVTVES